MSIASSIPAFASFLRLASGAAASSLLSIATSICHVAALIKPGTQLVAFSLPIRIVWSVASAPPGPKPPKF